MKAEDFIRSLLPDFDKTRITEDLRVTYDELRDLTIPAYKQAEQFLAKHKFISPIVQNLETGLKDAFHKPPKGDIITILYQALQNSLVTLAEVSRLIERSYSEDVLGQGLTFYKANLLQLAEYVQFVTRYARRLLNYIYVAETAEHPEQESVNEALVPADINWITANYNNFCNAIVITSKDLKEIENSLKNIPEIQITPDNTKTLEATLGKDKLDPLGFGFIPVYLNPIYHVRMAIAEWQVNKYHAAKQEIKCLQLRIANLKAVQSGKPDAKVQKEINYCEERVQTLLRKNAELERKLNS